MFALKKQQSVKTDNVKDSVLSSNDSNELSFKPFAGLNKKYPNDTKPKSLSELKQLFPTDQGNIEGIRDCLVGKSESSFGFYEQHLIQIIKNKYCEDVVFRISMKCDDIRKFFNNTKTLQDKWIKCLNEFGSYCAEMPGPDQDPLNENNVTGVSNLDKLFGYYLYAQYRQIKKYKERHTGELTKTEKEILNKEAIELLKEAVNKYNNFHALLSLCQNEHCYFNNTKVHEENAEEVWNRIKVTSQLIDKMVNYAPTGAVGFVEAAILLVKIAQMYEQSCDMQSCAIPFYKLAWDYYGEFKKNYNDHQERASKFIESSYFGEGINGILGKNSSLKKAKNIDDMITRIFGENTIKILFFGDASQKKDISPYSKKPSPDDPEGFQRYDYF